MLASYPEIPLPLGERDAVKGKSAKRCAKCEVVWICCGGRTSISIDVDFLVEMEPGSSLLDIVAIKQDLEDLLGRKVDVVTGSALSPYIRAEVLREAMSL